jgi:hypothetical protein
MSLYSIESAPIQNKVVFWSTVIVSSRICDQGDCSVPVATKSANKSGFVKDFLSKHPEGNVSAVNEAWKAAGMTGTIGDSLIYATRADMGLSGKLRAKSKSKPKTAVTPKSPTKMSEKPSSPGKSMFVKEFLNDHPQGNFSAVNEAWKAAGFEGTISQTVVDKMRASLGLTGNTRRNVTKSKPSTPGKKAGQLRQNATAPVSAQSRGIQSTFLEEMEADIDRLIFKAMAVGDLAEIEDTLRRARRLLYTAMIRS